MLLLAAHHRLNDAANMNNFKVTSSIIIFDICLDQATGSVLMLLLMMTIIIRRAIRNYLIL